MVIRGPFMAIAFPFAQRTSFRVQKEKMSYFNFFPFLTLNLLALFTTSAHLFCESLLCIHEDHHALRCLLVLAPSRKVGPHVKLCLATSAAALVNSRAIESNICFMLVSLYILLREK